MLHHCIVPCVGCFNISYRFDINIYIGSIFVFYIRAVCLRAHHKQGVGSWGRLVRLKILSPILSTNTTRYFLDIWWKSCFLYISSRHDLARPYFLTMAFNRWQRWKITDKMCTNHPGRWSDRPPPKKKQKKKTRNSHFEVPQTIRANVYTQRGFP